MNLYLALTKLNGSFRNSKLEQAIAAKGVEKGAEKGNNKGQLYRQLIDRYEKFYKDNRTNLTWYKQQIGRYYQAVTEFPCRCFIMNCHTPLVIGQGEASVLETFLTLHRIYGVPYLPGTAVKGAAAHFCHRFGDKDARFREGGEIYSLLFGSQEQQALITYHDAFPTVDSVGSAIRLDVMTPHHQQYNQMVAGQTLPGQAQAPRDDDSPIPIPFLAVSADFRLALTCRSNDPVDKKWLEIAGKIVSEALQQEGLGGKTNAGYGQLRLLTWDDDCGDGMGRQTPVREKEGVAK
ncbi:type III-B CRISPR module RAMP protein Cmr6 [Paenibacillus popilliae]|uniref:CRISPR type III-associated protein domain-containing protein n=1 Tax=Paenibacillus popilliae ATCC 14706 TaxID=1212764 RepID=M9L981_PAEPP|nr:type III-B CRISPR module RAMP protein Cmr6 [Paenibacillus popilliae]GAC41922.1 uncharacterized protein PPOP_1279 [Paenibacillus popilliae ATCC 14706]